MKGSEARCGPAAGWPRLTTPGMLAAACLAVGVVTLVSRTATPVGFRAIRSVQQSSGGSVRTLPACAAQNQYARYGDPALSFMDLALEANVDKVPNLKFTWWPTHSYQTLYERYLDPLRNNPLRMLEIGLGCNMPQGPGASIGLWKRYLPCAHLSMLEYAEKCAKDFSNKVDRMFIGDQADEAKLREVNAGGPYDVVVDDGGHGMHQQINSLRFLFPVMPPGSMYFLEDMSSSFEQLYAVDGYSTHFYLSSVLAHMHADDQKDNPKWKPQLADAQKHLPDIELIARLTLHVDCQRALCVLVRNDQEA